MSLKIRFILILLTCLLVQGEKSCAQWTGSYGNEWINYSQPYIRVGVSSSGIHKISLDSLPGSFPKNDITKFQLWNRGKEVSILSVSSKEIVFYGEANDGASDSLLFRPASDRLNPYTSLFSEERSYFLTLSNTAKRSKAIDGTLVSGETEPYHIQKFIKKFDEYKYNTTQKGYTRESVIDGVSKQQFSFTSFGESSNLNQSFYNRSNAWVGESIYGDSVKTSVKDPLTNLFTLVPKLPKSYNETGVLTNWKSDADRKPIIEILVNGLHVGYHNVGVYVSPTAENIQTDQKLVSTMQFSGFGGEKRSAELIPNTNLSSDGRFNIKVLSRATTTSTDWIGLSYYTITYPQSMDMGGGNYAVFNLPATPRSVSRIRVANIPAGAKIYDVSNIYEVYEVYGKYDASDVEVMIPRNPGRELKLAVVGTGGVNIVNTANIHNVNFSPVYSHPQVGTEVKAITPANYDYLMITNNTLKEAAVEYAEYRSSPSGGQHNTLLVNIRDIYDQFNYGEPSPLAIKRFTNYMLKDGIRAEKHNLVLLGHSVTLPARIIKEMPDEVPTFGDPGSDILLVSGLQGVDVNVPSIPVGRIGALNVTDLRNYLAKVKAYEHSNELSWRKEVLHLNGGQSAAEIVQLRNILADLAPIIENGALGGRVDARVKQNPAEGAIERVNITNEINRGVGMMTYFGHGAQIVTDLDMGYVTDASRNYNNLNKYPLMFFNGCGVGNIYTSRAAHGLSGNWLLSGNLGSLAIISNSYKSYVSTSARHLKVLYENLFTRQANATLGQVIKDVALQIVKDGVGEFDIANLHQVYLHGDPVLKMVRVDSPDYKVDENEGIILMSERPDVKLGDSKVITTAVVVSNGGRYINTQKVPILLKYIYRDGSQEIKKEEFNAISYLDTLYFSNPINKVLHRVEVIIDEGGEIQELSKDNNQSVLVVDWDIAKESSVYPTEKFVDKIPPVLNVTFNGRMIYNNSVVSKNATIDLKLSDNYKLASDTTSFDVFIRNCPSGCDLIRISSHNLQVDYVSDREINIRYSLNDLPIGSYELLVNSRDVVGNSPTESYKINFIVEEENENILVYASPNPSADFVKFEIKSNKPELYERLEFTIFDSKGILVENRKLTSLREWYWFCGEKISGVYLYKVVTFDSKGNRREFSGKVIKI